jgi:hypothetical protein
MSTLHKDAGVFEEVAARPVHNPAILSNNLD